MEKCRICLRYSKNVLSIYTKADGITFADMMSLIANIKIRNEDGFSDNICRSCRGKLAEAYKFKLDIERAEMVLQETSNMKKINFSNLHDIKIKIKIETDCKPSMQTFSENLFKEGLDCLSYNNIVIKKIENLSKNKDIKNKKALSVGEFLNSIKTESDNDCDYDYEIGADDYNSDSGSNYSYDMKKKITEKKKVKDQKQKQTDKQKECFKPLLAKPIKPKYIADLRLARSELAVKNKPRARKPPKDRPKNSNVCPYCGKLFQQLNDHILIHTAERKFKCDQCQKAFFTEGNLKSHMKLHLEIKKFKCDQCIAAFHNIATLKTHMLSHSDERKYACDICNKAFKRKPQRERHRMIHNFGSKPNKCELCPMTFITKHALRLHMHVHTGERPFRCEITRPFVFVIFCFGFFILIQSLVPKVMAMKNSNVDEYTLEDKRTRKRKNYVVRLARDSELLGNSGNIGTNYDMDSIQPDPANSEELSAFIVDYANMIRNDVVLLDKSVETRTRKRGKVGKHHNQVIPDLPCACNPTNNTIHWGEETIPRSVKTFTCSEQACPWPYGCKENLYNLTIIKKKETSHQYSQFKLPEELERKWVGEYRSISVGCECSRDYYGTAN